jgi:hypothetical protein
MPFMAFILVGSDAWSAGLDRLVESPDSIARRSGIWVIKSTQDTAVTVRMKPLIRDSDPSVRHAAFAALLALRESAAKRAQTPVERITAERVAPDGIVDDAVIEDEPVVNEQPAGESPAVTAVAGEASPSIAPVAA